jgi:hypothetical protein
LTMEVLIAGLVDVLDAAGTRGMKTLLSRGALARSLRRLHLVASTTRSAAAARPSRVWARRAARRTPATGSVRTRRLPTSPTPARVAPPFSLARNLLRAKTTAALETVTLRSLVTPTRTTHGTRAARTSMLRRCATTRTTISLASQAPRTPQRSPRRGKKSAAALPSNANKWWLATQAAAGAAQRTSAVKRAMNRSSGSWIWPLVTVHWLFRAARRRRS